MANLGSLNSSPFFLSWIQSLEAETLDDALNHIEGLASITSEEGAEESSTLKKVKDEDILALMPPPPNINLAAFQNISNNFADFFGIDRASLDKAFGATESAITLAAATTWAKSQMQESELVKQILASEEKNPLTATLSQYIAQAPMVGLDALALQQMLRQSPVVSSLFHGVDPNIALKAYQIAEQQIVLSMLDKWVQAEAIRAEQLRENMKIEDVKAHEIAHQMLNDYIKNSEMRKEPLAQPALSVLVSAIVVGVSMSASVQALSGVLGAASSTIVDTSLNIGSILKSLLDPLQTELRVLTSGLLATATAWATPVAMTLIMKGGIDQTQDTKTIDKESIRSFVITFATFLTNPNIDKLFFSRIAKAQEKQNISGNQAILIVASLKASLLAELLAVLYKSETGGFSFKELQALIKTPLGVDDTSTLNVITKLLQEQLRIMQETDPKAYKEFTEQLEAQYKDADSSTELHLSSLIDPIRTFISLWDPQLTRRLSLTDRG